MSSQLEITSFRREPLEFLALDGCAWVNRSRIDETVSSLFEPLSFPHVQIRDGRGQAYQIFGSFGSAALRHYCRGGMFGALLKDRYLFQGYARTRAFRELKLLAHLYALNLPVPEPLACRVLVSGLIYRADLLTAWIAGAVPLSQRIKTVQREDFFEIGEMLKRFFDIGLWHADLNAHNVLLTAGGPALIDFDRCELRRPDRSGKVDNVARLQRSLVKLGFAARPDFAATLWPALVEGLHSNT